ncbi:hypothetical protein TcWFU_002076 [Taenia crassiceps]|uniref:Uncharacterized protein n=1 Tax=Taenia crassiceps TaxID=6207 RepID=A0ABR4QK19_9CEST
MRADIHKFSDVAFVVSSAAPQTSLKASKKSTMETGRSTSLQFRAAFKPFSAVDCIDLSLHGVLDLAGAGGFWSQSEVRPLKSVTSLHSLLLALGLMASQTAEEGLLPPASFSFVYCVTRYRGIADRQPVNTHLGA